MRVSIIGTLEPILEFIGRTVFGLRALLAMIDRKNIEDVVSFGKNLKKIIVITRGDKGSLAIKNNEVVEFGIEKNLKVIDLTGAGDLFAAGFLHGHINNLSAKDLLLVTIKPPSPQTLRFFSGCIL